MHRQDGGEKSEHANREQRPYEKEVSAVIGDAARKARALSFHVDEWHYQRKERQQKRDDVPRSPFGEHERSVQPNYGDRHNQEVVDGSRLVPIDNVLRQVSYG